MEGTSLNQKDWIPNNSPRLTRSLCLLNPIINKKKKKRKKQRNKKKRVKRKSIIKRINNNK